MPRAGWGQPGGVLLAEVAAAGLLVDSEMVEASAEFDALNKHAGNLVSQTAV